MPEGTIVGREFDTLPYSALHCPVTREIVAKSQDRESVYEADHEHLGKVEGCGNATTRYPSWRALRVTWSDYLIARVVLNSFWIPFEDTLFFI